jgi:hypothetical protein
MITKLGLHKNKAGQIKDMIDAVEHLKSLLDKETDPHEIDLFSGAIRTLESALKDLNI